MAKFNPFAWLTNWPTEIDLDMNGRGTYGPTSNRELTGVPQPLYDDLTNQTPGQVTDGHLRSFDPFKEW